MPDHRLRRWPSITLTLGERLVFPANTKTQPNVGGIADHRLRRWPKITLTLGERLVSLVNTEH